MGRLAGLRAARVAAALLPLVATLACASAPSGRTVHVVRPGENLYRISLHYGVDVARLRRANGIRDVTSLQVGQKLRIPGSRRGTPKRALAPAPGVARPPAVQGDRGLALREADLRFGWPIRGKLSSGFGWRRGSKHEGIDIAARGGTPIRAAEAGRVVHSGWLGDYGRVVIIKHSGRYSSVYAHNASNKVAKGAFVERGDVVATVGRSGNADGTHLHFELRRDRVAQNPLAYLPESDVAKR